MKAFPGSFATAKNSLTGQEPVWIFKFTAGGVTYYLSDNAFSVSPWAVTTKGWVRSWGQQQEGISGTLDEFRITDFNLDILVDPASSPNMEALAITYELESSEVSLYLWFYGCADAPQEMFRGYVKGVTIPDESVVQISLQDESLRLERAMIGTKVDLTTYPKADPDDVGKVIPIPFGSLSRLRTLAINAGIQTTLPAAINATTTSFVVTTGTGIVPGMVVQIDDEQITVNSISGSTITNCTRGVNATVAAVHAKGAVLWEYRTDFVYVVADGPVASIPKAYAKVGGIVLDISSVCTAWPAGNHPTYPGLAVVSVPGFITVQQAINLAIYDGISVTNGTLDASLSGNVTKTGSATLTGAPALTGNVSLAGVVGLVGTIGDPGHTHTTGQSSNESTTTSLPTNTNWTGATWGTVSWGGYNQPWWYWTLNFPADGARSSCTYTITVTITVNPGYSSDIDLYVAVGGMVGVYSYSFGVITGTTTFTFTHNTGTQTYNTIYVGAYGTQMYMQVTSASRSIQLTGLASSSNNSVAATNGSLAATNGNLAASNSLAVTNNTLGVADGIGISDTLDPGLVGNVLKTGTVSLTGNSVANTMVGDEILCDVVSLYTGVPDVFTQVASRGGYSGTIQMVGSWPGSYVFAGAITEYQSALYWLNYFAFQSRAWFKLARGTAQVIFRPDVLTSGKNLTSCRISGGKKVHSRSKTDYDEILNKVQVLYKRDWSQDKSAGAYAAVSAGSDSVSISNYGARERAELFMFDFVSDSAMAADLLAFYLGWYKSRHWLHGFDTFLNDAELEFGDAVQLDFSSGQTGQVLETQFAPGSAEKSDTIGLVVVV